MSVLGEGCRWCGMIHGKLCPSVKAIEFHPDGTVRRVEFKSAQDYGATVSVPTVVTSPKPTAVTTASWPLATGQWSHN
jgi:hypothetical protein